MDRHQYSQYFLRLFKGAPLSCLVAIFIHPLPITLSHLKALTGYNTGELLPALELLCNHGIIRKLPDSTWEFSLPMDALETYPSLFARN